MRTLLVIAAACLVAACSSSPPSAPSTTTSAAGAGKCADVVKEQAKVTDELIDRGCTDTNGALRFGKVQTCKNGQRLWQMDKMIGLSGEPMIPEDRKTSDGLPAPMVFQRVCTG